MKIKSAKGVVTHYSPGKKPVSRKVELKWRVMDGKEVKPADKATRRKRRKAS